VIYKYKSPKILNNRHEMTNPYEYYNAYYLFKTVPPIDSCFHRNDEKETPRPRVRWGGALSGFMIYIPSLSSLPQGARK
jgi:hypothetical protein